MWGLRVFFFVEHGNVYEQLNHLNMHFSKMCAQFCWISVLYAAMCMVRTNSNNGMNNENGGDEDGNHDGNVLLLFAFKNITHMR